MKNMARERAREIAERNKLMKVFGRLPSGFKKWVENELFKGETFLAFNNKTRKAYCSACHTEIDIPKHTTYKHNHIGTCPVCGKQVIYTRENVKKYEVSVKWSLVVQSHGEDVLLRYIRCIKEYSDNYRNYEISFQETLRTICTAHDHYDFQYVYFVNGWIPYRDESWNYYHRPTVYDLPTKGLEIYNPDGIKRTLSGTWAKYSGAEIIAKENITSKPYRFENYLGFYRKAPALEKLLRVGFVKLVDYSLNQYALGVLNAPQATNLRSALGLSAHQLKLLHATQNPSYEDLRLVRKYPNMSLDLFLLLRDRSIFDVENIMKLGETVNVLEMLRYMKEHSISWPDFRDHVNFIDELGMNRTKKNLYPEDFTQAHRELTARVIGRREKKKAEEIAELNKLIRAKHDELVSTEPLSLREDGLIIMFPQSYQELAFEGESLHHCVRTYAEKVAAGETMVFFIRKESEPLTPFYTLEWRDGRIIQCRGRGNVSAVGPVRRFADHFSEKMNEYLAA